jgi:Ala-tRNA(Pro) deacylase
MQCKERLETYFRESGVPFQVQHHPMAYTAQRVAESEHIPGKMVAKAVMVFADSQPVMLALPADYRVSFEKAAGALGVKEVRLAHEDEFADTFPDCEVGAMPPLGNLYGLPVYVDRHLAEDETIVFQAGTHADTMSLQYADYERLVHPTVADLALHA